MGHIASFFVSSQLMEEVLSQTCFHGESKAIGPDVSSTLPKSALFIAGVASTLLVAHLPRFEIDGSMTCANGFRAFTLAVRNVAKETRRMPFLNLVIQVIMVRQLETSLGRVRWGFICKAMQPSACKLCVIFIPVCL